MKYSVKISFILILFVSGVSNSYGQIRFQLAIGSNQYEIAESIVQSNDNGYVVCGSIQRPTSYYDIYIVKISSTGVLQWSKTIGEANQEHGTAIIRTTDGGYVVAGGTASLGAGDYDMYIIKLDASGNVLWAKTIGGTSHDEAFSIVQTTDGGYAVAGNTSSFGAGASDVYLVKLDAFGTPQWSRTIGGTNTDVANSLVQTTDGGYVIVGETASFGAYGMEMYILKLDSSGTLQWSKTIGTPMGSSFAKSIIQTTEGNFVVAGSFNSLGAGTSNMYIVKLSTTGALLWSRTIGGTGYDYAHSIIQTTDGSLVVAGETNSTIIYIVKLNTSGTIQWISDLYSPGYEALSIIQTSDGGYAAAGVSYVYSNGDMYVVKLDSSGNSCGNVTNPVSQPGTGGTINSQVSTVTSPNSTVISQTPTTSTSGAVTIICLTPVEPISSSVPSSFELSQNYPNPFNPSTTIRFDIPNVVNGRDRSVKLIIYDVLGREVATLINQQMQPGSYSIDWDASNYPSGVYFYQLSINNEQIASKKMVLIK